MVAAQDDHVQRNAVTQRTPPSDYIPAGTTVPETATDRLSSDRRDRFERAVRYIERKNAEIYKQLA